MFCSFQDLNSFKRFSSFYPALRLCIFARCVKPAWNSLAARTRLAYIAGMTTTVEKDNSVRIPPELTTELAIQPGTCLDWQRGATPGVLTVVVLPNRQAIAESLLGAGRKFLKPGQDPIAELIAEREHDDRERNAVL